MKPIGIDLGTTFSAVACLDTSGRSMMVRNGEGELLTPSVVLFSNREVVVGKGARGATATRPDEVAEWVKRDMGAAAYHRRIHGEYLPPEVIQACILRKLKADVAELIGPEARVVITVPAYFDEPRRKATADAGEMAGLKVLDIVNEPTAAALAFAEVFGYLSPSGTVQEPMTVLVYDLGGGTFDATLLRLAPGDVRTIATDGDVQLGGHDWDARLVDHVAEQFLAQRGLDPRQDPAALGRLFDAVVEAKHTLSVRTRAPLRFGHAGKSLALEITRQQFRDLTADLLERTAYTTRQLIADAGLDWQQVDRVLLVGGSTRMPVVAQMLEGLTGITPDRTVNPDEAVARGAAIYAGYLLAKRGDGAAAGFEVTNVNSHSLGIEGIDPDTLRKTNVLLIPRNTPLPVDHTWRFQTKRHDQRSIVVQVLEGESSLPGDCTAIGRTVVRDLPGSLPQGWPVDVTFRYATNGRLTVRAVVPGTEQAAELTLERTVGLSNDGIARWKTPINSAAGFGAFQSAARQEVAAPAAGSTGAAVGSSPTVAGVRDASSRAVPGAPPAATAARSPAPPSTDGAAPAAPQEARARAAPAGKRRVSPGTINVVGHVLAALVGLGLGYLVLSWLRPDTFPLPW